MGDTALTPYDMGTFGSRTTPTMGPQLRTMAAAARQMLLEAAAARWQLDAASLTADAGKVLDPRTARSFTYGELTRRRRISSASSSIQESLTPAADWKIAGTPVPKADGRDFVTGRHQYPSDIVRARHALRRGPARHWLQRHAGLPRHQRRGKAARRPAGPRRRLHRRRRPERFHRPARRRRHPGPVERPRAALQQRTLPAPQGQLRIPATARSPPPAPSSRPWPPRPSVSTSNTPSSTSPTRRWSPAPPSRSGTAPTSPSGPEHSVPSAFATSSRRPSHLAADQVHVIQPDMGSGYGGKHTGEAAVEAARLARAAGKPVKARLDPRRGVHLGLLPPRRSD